MIWFLIGLFIGWFTAGPIVLVALGLMHSAAVADEIAERNADR